MAKAKATKKSGTAGASSIKAYSYVRMSTKEQLEGDSLRRQLEKSREYAKKEGLDLEEGNYEDIGIRAYRGDNIKKGKLRLFLDALEEGSIQEGSYLIIESMDRLTRQSALQAILMLNEIIGRGIVVVTLDDGTKYSAETIATNPYQLFIAIGAMTRAHDESRRKSGLLSEVWAEKRRQLRSDRKMMTAAVPAWLKADKTKGVLTVVEERAKIVREIFELTCNGYGIYSIAKMLNERGEPAWGTRKKRAEIPKSSKRSSIWRDSYIKKIILNRAVLGEFQPRKTYIAPDNKQLRVPEGEVVHGYYPQIISHEVFRDAHLAMERRRNGSRGRKGEGYANLFTGILRCSQCGSGMRYLNKGGRAKEGRYLRCSISVSGGGCISKSYKYDVVEHTLLSALDSLDIGKVLGGTAYARRLSEKKHARELERMKLEDTQERIASVNNWLSSNSDPKPKTTLANLIELERDAEACESSIRRLDDEISEILVIDPEKRKSVLDALMRRIKDEKDKKGKVLARRALAGELQRMIEKIVIRPNVILSYEVSGVHESWNSKNRYTGKSRLEQHLEDHGFEISIRYRNGQQMIIDGVSHRQLKLKWNKAFTDLRLIAKYSSQASDQ